MNAAKASCDICLDCFSPILVSQETIWFESIHDQYFDLLIFLSASDLHG